jgi:hypothetical protein
MSLGSIAWVDKMMRGAWPQLQQEVAPELLPRPTQIPGTRKAKFVWEELGCGHYGCVLPTAAKPGTVVKVTSDVTEAMFVAHLIDQDIQPEQGLVHYDRILGVPDTTHRGRPIFIIWRAEAYDVGFMAKQWQPVIEDWQKRSLKEGERYLELFKTAAGDFRDKMSRVLKQQVGSKFAYGPGRAELYATIWKAFEDREGHVDIEWDARPEPYSYAGPRYNQATTILRRYRGFDRQMVALNICRQSAQMLANTDLWYELGEALDNLLDEGFLLADVHLNNIGHTEAGGKNMIITDPGHAQPISPARAAIPPMEILGTA